MPVPKHGSLPTSRWNPASDEKEERIGGPSMKCQDLQDASGAQPQPVNWAYRQVINDRTGKNAGTYWRSQLSLRVKCTEKHLPAKHQISAGRGTRLQDTTYDLLFTGTLWVKTGEMPVWRRMYTVSPVHCKGPMANQLLVGLHLRSTGVPLVLPVLSFCTFQFVCHPIFIISFLSLE
ncbi:hypothetical protein HAX54_020712 [Datura stramonium]|uniref:Uncharacterized protein n=1 Tax=Datura stramonium TaxID=4076 RepID=A0ABS8UU18_DATST|nr:hypothetical protein [Datura stramonium]